MTSWLHLRHGRGLTRLVGTAHGESLDRAPGLMAVHDGNGHVQVTVTLRGEDEEQAWPQEATPVVEPGQQMRTAAGEVARLLG